MTPSNKAAILAAKFTPLVLKGAVYTSPDDHEVVIKNAAVAINPFDWILPEGINFAAAHLKVPIVIGTDVAGRVVEVGNKITRFKVGDRVLGHAVSAAKSSGRSSEGAFQLYTVLREHMTSPIPDAISYEEASVIPLGLSTAATSLYDKRLLALPYPSASAPLQSLNKTVLIWGGSTSVGCNAIQLAVASGLEVITTCSPKNFELVKSLGASQAFDYNSKTVIKDIIAAFKGKQTAGALSVGKGSLALCIDIMSQCQGNKFVVQVSFDIDAFPKTALATVPFIFAFARGAITTRIRLMRKGVELGVCAADELESNELSRKIYQDYLPQALEKKAFIPSPQPRIVGEGLEMIQEAMNLQKKGVSAQKLVVKLS